MDLLWEFEHFLGIEPKLVVVAALRRWEVLLEASRLFLLSAFAIEDRFSRIYRQERSPSYISKPANTFSRTSPLPILDITCTDGSDYNIHLLLLLVFPLLAQSYDQVSRCKFDYKHLILCHSVGVTPKYGIRFIIFRSSS